MGVFNASNYKLSRFSRALEAIPEANKEIIINNYVQDMQK